MDGLEESFELLSTMSPKIKKYNKNKYKKVTKLALRRPCNTDDTETASSDSTNKSEKNEVIIISDSDDNFSAYQNNKSLIRSIKSSDIKADELITTKLQEDCSSKPATPGNMAKDKTGIDTALSKEAVQVTRKNTDNLNKGFPAMLSYKYEAISKWVDEVNSEQENYVHENDDSAYNVTQFTELSMISGDMRNHAEHSKLDLAANSTFVNERNCFRFDELFHGSKTVKEKDCKVTGGIASTVDHSKEKSDSKVDGKKVNSKNRFNFSPKTSNVCSNTENNDDHLKRSSDKCSNKHKNSLVIEDSFEEGENEKDRDTSVKSGTPLQTLEVDEDYEKMLDELYGNSWRINKEKILPKSEPKPKKKLKPVIQHPKTEMKPRNITSITHKNPYLEMEKKKCNNLLRTLQSARMKLMIESPLIKNLRTLCDSDTNSDLSDDKRKNIVVVKSYKNYRTKLTFNDSDSEDEDVTEKIVKTFPPNIRRVNKLQDTDTKTNIVCSGKTNNVLSSDSGKSTSRDFSDSENVQLNIIDNQSSKLLNTNRKLTTDNSKEKDCILKEDTKNTKGKPNLNVNKKPVKTKKKEKKFIVSDTSSLSESSLSSNEWMPIKLKTKSNGPLSFLASLNQNVTANKCEASAKLFRDCYKTYKTELANKLFALYNENIFDNALPHDTQLDWNDRMRGTAGFCYCKKITRRTGAVERKARIVLSTKVLDSADRLRDTLVHEMCHAATWIVNEVSDGHGAFWRSWANKAMKTFPELPPIRRCHDYQINTKFTYKCTQCGYSIGRHSKSLDLEIKRCGYCHGKFELLINKNTKNGIQSVPVTPKKEATGFALFVKENYGSVKNPQLNHKDVMKVLGQKFSEMKLNKKAID